MQRMGTSPSFTATVSAITDAFGDPTRRSIYLYAKEYAKEHSVGSSCDWTPYLNYSSHQ
jgi:hypothetical protein